MRCPAMPEAPSTKNLNLLHRLVLAALEGQLHILGGLDLLDRAGDVQALGVVGGVGLVGLRLDLPLDEELMWLMWLY